MNGLTLDAGALIAIERADRRINAWISEALDAELEIVVPAGALAQALRDGAKQVRLVRLLASDHVSIDVLDGRRAREAGTLCGLRGTADIVDAAVVLCARSRRHAVVTSDPDELLRLDPRLEVLVV